MHRIISLLLLTAICKTGFSQTYVGEILLGDEFQYIKLKYSGDTCTFSLPYLDGRQNYTALTNPQKKGEFDLYRNVEKWSFNLKLTDDLAKGTIDLPNGVKKAKLRKQVAPILQSKLSKYTGTFSSKNHSVIIYDRYNYLHMISPFSEETVSLKPIAEGEFWSTSGEHTSFSGLDSNKFQNLKLTDRSGNAYNLSRVPDFNRKSIWLSVNNDSIYAEVFLPQSEKSVPSVLILPGGGNQSQIDNFIYEARYFASLGMAAMIFDKPGVGKSTGRNFDLLSFKEKAEYYAQVLDTFVQMSKVDPEKTGLHGSSEGGRLALMMAENHPDKIAFVNAVAAPIMTMKEGQLYAMNHYHRNQGMSEETILEISSLWLNYYNGIIEGKIDSSLVPQVTNLSQQYQRAFLPPASSRLPGSPSRDDLLDKSVYEDAQKISCPVLLQYGENDQRVNPYGSIRNFYPNFTINEELDILIYNRANHSLMTPEYEISKGFLADKKKWLKKWAIL